MFISPLVVEYSPGLLLCISSSLQLAAVAETMTHHFSEIGRAHV